MDSVLQPTIKHICFRVRLIDSRRLRKRMGVRGSPLAVRQVSRNTLTCRVPLFFFPMNTGIQTRAHQAEKRTVYPLALIDQVGATLSGY